MNPVPPVLPPSSAVPPPPPGEPRKPNGWQRFVKALGPVGVVLLFLLKIVGKVKFFLVPILKFGWPILKTGGTMIFTMVIYAQLWGWKFAVGFVVLILVHECGHLLAAKQLGLNVGAPVFIPFMGAFIALKEAPRNAWVEAWVGIGGPLLGTLGSAGCWAIYLYTGNLLFAAIAYSGFWLNLFNLTPVGFLDGGRIATAISPWLWVIGLVLMVARLVLRPFSQSSMLLVIIILASLPRVWSLFRPKSDAERRYFEVTPTERVTMSVMYFGLAIVLAWGMHVADLRLAAARG